MIAIILAGGQGSRLRPLTDTIPKPLIEVGGKSILEHNLDILCDYLDEVVIVVKYKKEKIIEKIGDKYKNIDISYHVQGEKKGTAGALINCKLGIMNYESKEDILILNGDSIFDKSDIANLVNLEGYGALVQKVNNPEKYGIFKQNNDGFAQEIIEKPESFVGDLANMGVYKFSSDIIKMVEEVKKSARGEYEITDAINDFLVKNNFKLIELKNDFIDISYPWDVLGANNYYLENIKSDIKGELEQNVNIKGEVILGKGSILKSGTYIEGNVIIGENTSIGPNTYIRGNTVIGNNSKVGNAVEIKNSSLGNNTNIAHLSYIGDSIIGNNINIGGGMITANLRHDKKNIMSIVKGQLQDTGLKKLGVIIGDNTKTGINTSVFPGRIIDTNSFTMPNEEIR